MNRFRRLRSLLPFAAAALVAGFVAGCATPPSNPEDRAEYDATNDPLEPLNRHIFNFNRGVDFWLLRPVTVTYRELVPDAVQKMVTNFLSNLRQPLAAANALLQNNPERAGQAFGRFVTNTFVGVGGLFDAMPDVPAVNEDFGQTFAVWGSGEGPYLMLPFIGPSNPRDAAGLAVEYFVDPVDLVLSNHFDAAYLSNVRLGAEAVDDRSNNIDTLDEIERTSLDFYAVVRSLYRQRRSDEIRNGERPTTPPSGGRIFSETQKQ